MYLCIRIQYWVKLMIENYEVLFIEDSIIDAKYYMSLIREIHGKENLSITHVRKISTFEKLASRKKFHLILLDIHLHEYSGVETIKKVRDIEQRSPIIILTGDCDRKLASSALMNGANDYLV